MKTGNLGFQFFIFESQHVIYSTYCQAICYAFVWSEMRSEYYSIISDPTYTRMYYRVYYRPCREIKSVIHIKKIKI